MLVCYALEDRSRWFILGFAAACALGSIYGFLQGEFGINVHRTPLFFVDVHLHTGEVLNVQDLPRGKRLAQGANADVLARFSR